MDAISSYRPFEDSQEISRNQLKAKETWEPLFNRITYFGPVEDALKSPKTYFVECLGKPSIKSLALHAGHGFGWKSLINSDIQIDPKAKNLERILNRHEAACAFSFRIPIGKTEKKDLGIDFFLATTDVWHRLSHIIPEQFTIGRQQWDTWVLSFFFTHYGEHCFDLSPMKLIYHPDHEERNDQGIEIIDPYLKNMTWRCKPLRF